MSSDDARASGNHRDELQDLQFDRVETTVPAGTQTQTTSPGVVCVVCGKSVGGEYYTANGKPVCANCRNVVMTAAATPRSIGPLLLAGLFGLGAAIAGAAIYYAVIAIANLEIGIVAILIGYMVGWAVRKGAGGRGGRRFQILAVILTYWAVGLAYSPLAFKQLSGSIGALVPLIFALPVVSTVGSLPFGLISALIIFIGLRQAWVMTAPHVVDISGPFKIGTGTAPTAT
jgi:hypothetical protein